MPFPEDIVRVSIRGDITSGGPTNAVEEFVHKIDLKLHKDAGAAFNWADEMDNIADAMATKWTAHFSLLRGMLPASVYYREVRVYHLDNTAHTLHMAQAPITGSTNGTGATSLPAEVATVVSLYTYAAGTFNAAGGKARGRFYLPPLATNVLDGDGTLSSISQANLLDWAVEWLNDVQGVNIGGGVDDTHFDVVVASGVDGVARQVQQLRVGQVFDVQRRRRRDLAESYVSDVLVNH